VGIITTARQKLSLGAKVAVTVLILSAPARAGDGGIGNGQRCEDDGGSCQSGYCIDGYCCDESCGEPCEVCNGADRNVSGAVNGQCVLAPIGFAGRPSCEPTVCNGDSPFCAVACTPPSGSTPSQFCAPGNYCVSYRCMAKKPNGQSCTQDCPAGGPCEACLSGNCVDGVCCDTPCEGDCVACSAQLKGQGEDGHCENVAANLPGRPKGCAKDPPNNCGYTGLCDGTGYCQVMSQGFVCDAPHCEDGKAFTRSCDGAGGCAIIDCPYGCDATGTECATCADGGCDAASSSGDAMGTSEVDSSVVDGAPADGAPADSALGDGAPADDGSAEASTASPGPECDGASVVEPNGGRLPCAPYACRQGACLTQCESLQDCTMPNVCNFQGQCGMFVSGELPKSCTISPAPGARSPGFAASKFAVVALLALAGRIGRRRGARAP
jgi:hypothetical protein